MTEIQNTGPISPQDRTKYEEEYKHGVDLFQRALAEYSKADEPHKKEAFRDVMDKAMQVLNDTAQALKRSDLFEKNSQIQQDLQTYQATQNAQAKTQLETDLKRAQDTLS
jgi:hypothetical protein